MRCLAVSANKSSSIWEHSEGLLLLLLPAGARGHPLCDTYTEMMVQEVLSASGLYCTWNSLPFFRVRGHWRPYDTPAGLRSDLLRLMAILTLAPEGDPDPDTWLKGNDDGSLLEALAKSPQVRLVGTVPAPLLAGLVAPQERGHVQRACGVLHHPIHGAPVGLWLESGAALGVDPAAASRDFPHLKRLYSAFELTPWSHAALYCTLLGAVSSVSLDSPRPLLLVDSWEQGRGKSEVCGAIARVLDDNEGSVPARNGEDRTFFDDLAARLRGARTVTTDNIDGVKDFNSTLLASAASGTVSLRWKYARQEALVQGVIPAVNLVAGQATLHEDMLSRAVRCELPGTPRRLSPSPLEYAREYRRELLAEILSALADPAPVGDCLSRTQRFDQVALGAYRAVFGTDATTPLEESRRQAMAHSTPVVENLACLRPGAFSRFPERLLRDAQYYTPSRAARNPLPARLRGLSLLGHTLQEGGWA